MNNLEKKILGTVIDILKTAKKTDWKRGDFDKWHKFAVNMQKGINDAVPLLKTLIDAAEEDQKDWDKDAEMPKKHYNEEVEPESDLDKLDKLI